MATYSLSEKHITIIKTQAQKALGLSAEDPKIAMILDVVESLVRERAAQNAMRQNCGNLPPSHLEYMINFAIREVK